METVPSSDVAIIARFKSKTVRTITSTPYYDRDTAKEEIVKNSDRSY